MAAPPIRVLIADDQQPVRQALAEVLTNSGACEVVGEATNGTDAILMVQRYRPDVVVMDVSMPRVNGEDATRLILGVWPNTRVVALSADDSDETVQRMRAAGAVAYVTKGAPPDDLVAAIRSAAKS